MLVYEEVFTIPRGKKNENSMVNFSWAKFLCVPLSWGCPHSGRHPDKSMGKWEKQAEAGIIYLKTVCLCISNPIFLLIPHFSFFMVAFQKTMHPNTSTLSSLVASKNWWFGILKGDKNFSYFRVKKIIIYGERLFFPQFIYFGSLHCVQIGLPLLRFWN
jgi:hypothetical protein